MNRTAGRPPLYAAPMTKRNVLLDADTIASAREMGGGNVSLGLRLAVAVAVTARVAIAGTEPEREALEVASPAGTNAGKAPVL